MAAKNKSELAKELYDDFEKLSGLKAGLKDMADEYARRFDATTTFYCQFSASAARLTKLTAVPDRFADIF
jgi:hypothetical protein